MNSLLRILCVYGYDFKRFFGGSQRNLVLGKETYRGNHSLLQFLYQRRFR